jgi:transcriptional regulator with XRE-family HTH domain
MCATPVDIAATAGSGVNPIDARVGAAIRLRRLERNLTRLQLAKAAGIAPSLLGNYKAGRTRVDADHLRRIATVLRQSAGSLFGLPATRR